MTGNKKAPQEALFELKAKPSTAAVDLPLI